MVKDMTRGPISKNLFAFSVPVIITLLCQNLFSIVDSMMVGRLVDASALGSVSSCSVIINFFMLVANGFATGYKVVIGQYFGAGRTRHTREAIYTTLFIMGGISLLVTVLGISLSTSVLKVMNTVPNLFDGANLYLTLYFVGITLIIFQSGGNNIFYALGDTKTPMLLQMAQLVLHIALDFFLLGYCNMGITGLAVAGWVSRGITLIPLMVLLYRRIKPFGRAHRVFSYKAFHRITTIAVPSAIAHGASTLQSLLIARLRNQFGEAIVTGDSIYWNITNFFWLAVNGLASGAGSFAAQNIGAGHIRRIKRCGLLCLGVNLLYSVVMISVSLLFGKNLVHLFISADTDPALVTGITDYTYKYFIIGSISVLVYNIGHVYCEMLRSVGRIRITMLASLTCIVSRVIFAYSFAPVMGPDCIIWSLVVSWIIYYVYPTVYYFLGRWMPHYRGARNPEVAANHENLVTQIKSITE